MKNQEFEELYEEHASGLFGFLVYRTGDRALAEDLLADTFERVLTARRPFDMRKGGQKTWIYAIALNRLRDVARRKSAEERAMEQLGANPAPQNGHASIEQAELKQILASGLETLEEPEREALALRYGADLSLKEIATVLKVPRSTVEGRVYRGLKKLWGELVEDPAAPSASAV